MKSYAKSIELTTYPVLDLEAADNGILVLAHRQGFLLFLLLLLHEKGLIVDYQLITRFCQV